MVAEDGYIGVSRTQLRSANQSITMHPNVYLDSTCYVANNRRHLAGVIEAQNESSLFSSSLSDLVHHKLRLSSNKILSQQSSGVGRHNDELDPFKSSEEIERQTINSLLPDEEELFSGIADDMGHLGHAKAVDDLEDFDLFIGSGGIELEGYPRGLHERIHSTQRLPNGSKIGDASSYDSSRLYDGYPSSVRLPSVGRDFGHLEASHAFPRTMSDFHPHSPQVPLHNVVNVLPQRTFDSLSNFADDIRPKVAEKVNLGMRHLGLNGHGMELNEGGFGYSSNGVHIPQSTASKPNSYQQHHLRSLLIPNSHAFLNNNRAQHIGRLPGSPGAQNLMMNITSPARHQLQVGSAPVMKASLWERQQIYSGESHEASAYQMGSIRSLGIPGLSPPHPPEISSYGSLSHVTDTSKNGGLRSSQDSQQMGRMFHERNSMNSLPTSFGSPSERSRGRRNETNLSHSDRKHYTLNMDRILRGDDSRTTLMIKNIPNKYTSKMLLATIDEQHRGQYDFVYLPIDFKNKCNMGYAFINMIVPFQIVGFHQTFEGRKWEKFNSEKVATLAYARIQGKAALISHFQNSSLMNEDKRCRPILFHSDGPNAGDQEAFPMGTSFRTKSGRQPVGGSEEDE